MSGLFETGKKKLRNAFLVFSKEAMPVAFSWWLARSSMSHSVVKCTLGRLRPRPSIRHAIDHLAKVTQRLTVLATLLGNSAALKYLDNAWDVKDLFDQKWWNHCLFQFTDSKTCAFPRLQECRAAFYQGELPLTSNRRLGDLLSATARTLVTNVRVAVAGAFHPRLEQFVKRLLARYELDTGTTATAKAKHLCLRVFQVRFFRNRSCEDLPCDFPELLKTLLEGKAARLRERFPSLAKCGKAEWIKESHLPDILRLLHELHRHRDCELAQVMQDETCTEEEAHQFMRRGCLKAFKLLPLADYEVKYVPISSTVLWTCILPYAKELSSDPEERELIAKEIARQSNVKRKVDLENQRIKAAMGEKAPKRLRLEGSRKDQRTADTLQSFQFAFQALQPLRRGWQFANHIDSDGIGCSLHFVKEEVPDLDNIQESTKVIGKGEGRDLRARFPPVHPVHGQRVVGIDPGRRDMVVAVEPESGGTFKISTRRHAHEACRVTKANCKNDLLTAIADPFLPGKTLKEAMEASPPAKGISGSVWRTYLDYIIPRVDIRCKALHPYSLRRKRFQNYRKRDESLNAICKSIVSLANVNAALPLPALVAFGDGTRTFTGFGYSPAPQKRLRHRLETVFGARVTLIHEPMTSQICHLCSGRLLPKHGQTWCRRRKGTVAREIHAIRVCPRCKTDGKTGERHPLHLNRDVNAACNMVQIYYGLLATGERPKCFCV